MKAYWGAEVKLQNILTSAPNTDESRASHPGHFTLGKRTPGTHCVGGWVDPRSDLDTVVNRSIPAPAWNRNPAIQPIVTGLKDAIRWTDTTQWITSVGFWRWCIGIERIVLLDFIHRLVSQKIEELKIYIYQISQYTSTKFTQGSITNHRATYLGAYIYKPLKQVRHRWQ
jgi:hypothetical protein